MIKNDNSGRDANLWRATAEPGPRAILLDQELKTDIAIIGGGIMGCAAALTLAEAGASVALLEAQRIGEGASSRAGGFVVPHFTFGNPQALIDRLGDAGRRLVMAVGGSADLVFSLIKKHKIACDAQQGGWYQPAHCEAARDSIERIARAWDALGFPVEILSGAETESRTGVPGYAGSWFAPRGGTLHPLNYTQGLATAAQVLGARLFEHSPVHAVDKSSSGFTVHTPKGAVLAERVVICSNASSGGLAPRFENSMVRMHIWQAASNPIPENQRRHLFRNGEALSDTRANLFTYRFDRDWRIITGSLAAFGKSQRRQAEAMAKRLEAFLHLPERPTIDHIWSGTATVTSSRLPEVVITEDGLVSATACNGRGIAMATVAGEALAKAVLADCFDDLPLPLMQRPRSLNAGVQQALSRFYPYYGLVSDWFDSRWSRNQGR